jgi:hypothetical protein
MNTLSRIGAARCAARDGVLRSSHRGGSAIGKYRSRLIAAAAAIAATGAIAISGVTTATAAPASPRAAVTGTEHFQLMSTSATSNTASVIAHGVFTGAALDHMARHNLGKFVFSNGTIAIRHSNGTGTHSFNPRTCLLTTNVRGTYKVLGGTGKYAGISGHGAYQLSILGIGAKSGGKCSKAKPPVAFQELIRASGPVKL